MAKAMKLRFYGNSKRRTNYHENKVTKFDKVLVIIPIILMYIVIWLGWC
jgi:energy-coupling factor transporter transmembrane protein EcfT